MFNLPIEIFSLITIQLDCRSLYKLLTTKHNQYSLDEILRSRLKVKNVNKDQLPFFCLHKESKYICTGYNHSIIFNKQGEIYVFGGNNYSRIRNQR